MKKISILFSLLVVALAGLSLAACSNDDLNTDQYDNGGVTLGAFGPSPVLRGGTLYFFGTHLDRVTSVVLPGQANPVTDIKVEQGGSHSKISILVPAEGGEPGYVTLKANDGTELTTKSKLTFREDISISKVYIGTEGTLTGEVGDLLVFEGDYLNLMKGVKFENGFIVSDLEEHTRYKLSVRIPKEAGSGTVTLTDLVEDTPTELQAEETITIKLPEVAAAAQTKKAGQTVTITGNRLTQIETVQLAGGVFVNSDELTYAENGSSLSFTLPEAAADGDITLVTYSGQKISAGTLTTVTPTGMAISGTVKNGLQMTVTGTNMDLVKAVAFENAGDYTGELNVAADKVIISKVPDAAQDGNLTLKMQNGKTVTVAYTLVKPTVTSADPATVTAGDETVIYGTNLDLVAAITFPGDTEVTVEAKDFTAQEADGIQVTVPAACSGTGMKLVLKNETEVTISGILTISAATNPAISEAPANAVAGDEITITGKNFNNLANLYIGTYKVTRYTSKSNTKITFKVPDAPVGDYKFVMEDYDGNKFNGPAFAIVSPEIDIASFTKNGDLSAYISWPITMSWSDVNGKMCIQRPGLQKLNLVVGKSKFIFYKTSATGQIQLNDCNWHNGADLTGSADLTDWSGTKTTLELVFTEAMMKCVNGETSDGWGDNCFILQGDGITLTKVTILP